MAAGTVPGSPGQLSPALGGKCHQLQHGGTKLSRPRDWSPQTWSLGAPLGEHMGTTPGARVLTVSRGVWVAGEAPAGEQSRAVPVPQCVPSQAPADVSC